MCATLIQNLDRLDDSVKEEAEGIHNTLGKDPVNSFITMSMEMQTELGTEQVNIHISISIDVMHRCDE